MEKEHLWDFWDFQKLSVSKTDNFESIDFFGTILPRHSQPPEVMLLSLLYLGEFFQILIKINDFGVKIIIFLCFDDFLMEIFLLNSENLNENG